MAGGYARTRKGKREDIPFVKPRSSWDANMIRILQKLQDDGHVYHWEYETFDFLFPGKDEKARGNKKYIDDFFVVWNPDYPLFGLPAEQFLQPNGRCAGWIENKGRLKCGGWLPTVDLAQLDAAKDSDSRIKLQRVQRHYPKIAKRLWLIGEREWKTLAKQYKPLIEHWE